MPPRIKKAPVGIPPLDLEYRPFDTQRLREIIAATRHRRKAQDGTFEQEVELLNAAAMGLKQAREAKALPARWEAVDQLNRIRSRASALLEVLPIDDDGGGEDLGRGPQVHPGVLALLGPSLEAVLQEVGPKTEAERAMGLTSVELFGVVSAGEALHRAQEFVAPLVAACDHRTAALEDQPHQTGIDPARDFLEAACRSYLRIFGGKKLALSRESNDKANPKPIGPLIRFLTACWAVVSDTPKTPEALAGIIDRLRDAGRAR